MLYDSIKGSELLILEELKKENARLKRKLERRDKK